MEGLINIHNMFHGVDWLNKIFVFFTNLGDVGFIWLLITFVLFLFRKTRACSIVLAFSLAGGHLFNNIFLKGLFGRPRPLW